MFYHTCKSLTRERFIVINDRRTRNHADRKSRARSLAAAKLRNRFETLAAVADPHLYSGVACV